MEYLTLQKLGDLGDLPEDDVEIAEWDGKVRIRALTKEQQAKIRRSARHGDDVIMEKVEQGMLVHAVVEPKLGPEGLKMLYQRESGIVDRILTRIADLSGVTREELAVSQEAFDEAELSFPE